MRPQSRARQYFPSASCQCWYNPQGVVGPMRCQGTLLAHVQLGVNHNPIPFCMGLLPGLSQAACIGWVAPFQTQNPALVLVKLFVSLVISKPSYLSRALCAEGSQQLLPTYCLSETYLVYFQVLYPSHWQKHWSTICKMEPCKTSLDWSTAWCKPIYRNPLSLMFTHCIIFLSSCMLDILPRRILWETLPNELLKCKEIASVGFPSPTRWVTMS